jgi:hypothetical protein
MLCSNARIRMGNQIKRRDGVFDIFTPTFFTSFYFVFINTCGTSMNVSFFHLSFTMTCVGVSFRDLNINRPRPGIRELGNILLVYCLNILSNVLFEGLATDSNLERS